MKPSASFLNLPMEFWGYVRFFSQECGYTERGVDRVKVHRLKDAVRVLERKGLSVSPIVRKDGKPTAFGERLLKYFRYRAKKLHDYVEPRLMDADEAESVFEELYARIPSKNIPMNKQKGEKKHPNYFAGIINMLVEDASGGKPCVYKPRKLATIVDRQGLLCVPIPVGTIERVATKQRC